MWHKIRSHRITASKIGDLYRRRKDHGTLADRLTSTRHITTAAMRQGLAFEPVAAEAYTRIKDYTLNLYPCGVVVNYWCPWLAASPDRKVYNPDMFPEYGLLKIKCPLGDSVLERERFVQRPRRVHETHEESLVLLLGSNPVSCYRSGMVQFLCLVHSRSLP